MSPIKKTTSGIGEGVAGLEHPRTAAGGCEMSHFGKQLGPHLPRDPAILRLDMCLQETEVQVPTEARHQGAPHWKQPRCHHHLSRYGASSAQNGIPLNSEKERTVDTHSGMDKVSTMLIKARAKK